MVVETAMATVADKVSTAAAAIRVLVQVASAGNVLAAVVHRRVHHVSIAEIPSARIVTAAVEAITSDLARTVLVPRM